MLFVPFLRHPIFFDLLIRKFEVDFLSLRYIVVMHNKRTCNDVCKFFNCTVFLQDFRNSGKLKIIDGFSNFYSVYYVFEL